MKVRLHYIFEIWKRIKLVLFTHAVHRDGIYAPVLVVNGVVIDGLTRIKAAARLGIDIPTAIVSGEIKMVPPIAFEETGKGFKYNGD